MSFRSISTVTVPANQISVPPPAGIVDGDILVAFFAADTPAAGQTFPAGFTQITGSPAHSTADGQTFAVATKKASGESGNYLIGAGSGDGTLCIGGVACYSGRDATLYLHRTSVAENNTANPSAWTIPSAAFSSNTTGICDILWIAASDVTTTGGATHTPPAGFTEQADIASGFLALTLASKDNASAGETGVYSGSGSRTSAAAGWDVFAIALLQASGGGGGGSGNSYLLEGGAGALLLEAAAGFLLLEGLAGTLAATIPKLTMTGAVAVALSGSMAATMPKLTMTGTVAVADSAAIAATIPKLTMTAQAAVAISGVMSGTIPMLGMAATGTVPIIATHSPTMPMLTMTGQVSIPITGTVQATIPKLTLSMQGSVGTVTITGTMAGTVPKLTMSGVVGVAIGSTLVATIPKLILQMTGTVITPIPPVVDLPLGNTRVVFDPSRMVVRFDASRTSIVFDASKTRIS